MPNCYPLRLCALAWGMLSAAALSKIQIIQFVLNSGAATPPLRLEGVPVRAGALILLF